VRPAPGGLGMMPHKWAATPNPLRPYGLRSKPPSSWRKKRRHLTPLLSATNADSECQSYALALNFFVLSSFACVIVRTWL
jgi:hypothetical protein